MDANSTGCSRVFPTHVGVFLRGLAIHCARQGLPHTRGGVSEHRASEAAAGESSPHTWGCFLATDLYDAKKAVFPTHVGVFPYQEAYAVVGQGLPHTRGGVS